MTEPAESTQSVAQPAGISFGFVRGITPEKWARRWAAVRSRRPLKLVPIDAPADVESPSTDFTLVRTWPGIAPARSQGPNRSRHAVKLYEEAIVLVTSAHGEAADLTSIDVEELELVPLLDHAAHDASWPAATPWQDTSWRPQTIQAALELVATGVGSILMPGPLARHLTRKHDHRVIEITGEIAGSTVWATWEVEDDSNEMQELMGVLRGRTSRSSR